MERSFDQIQPSLDGRCILITGGTGSFGRHFVRTVLTRYKPQKLIVFSRDEMKQYEMASEFPMEAEAPIRYFIGDVRDTDRLELAMREVDYVVHAAALKHVPAAEYNPFECIHTNVLGAENVVRAALRCGVKRVIALSTDKAASPVNLYGASKLASDKIFVAANNLSGSIGTRYSVVRYGNVMGSRGSIVPFFTKLAREGAASLPITDERMTRFCITLQQGVDFVLSCLETMQGGEIFVPKIPSLRVLDLARAIAPDLPHRIVGVRPGEKIHELMVTADDARSTVELPDRYVILPAVVNGVAIGLGKPVGEGFSYASHTNSEWLDGDALSRLIGEHVGY